MKAEKLKKARRELLINVLGKSETLVELKEIKEALLALNKKEVVEKKITRREVLPDISLVLNKLDDINEHLSDSKSQLMSGELFNELAGLRKDLNAFMVKFIYNYTSGKVKIDWENKPKEEIDILSPAKWLYKALELILSGFFGKVVSFIGKATEYIREPDRIVVTDYDITEYYGNKMVVYKIDDNGKKLEIKRES